MSKTKQTTTEIYGHLIAGIGFMIPFVVTGGIATALSFLFTNAIPFETGAIFFATVGKFSLLLMRPAVSGGMAYSISTVDGLTAGAIAGFLTNDLNTAFFGAVIGGLLAGNGSLYLEKGLKLPASLGVLKKSILIPLVSSLVTSFLILFVLNFPLVKLNQLFTSFLTMMSDKNPVLLGGIIGFMMIIDLAGPVGKAAYFFGVASLNNLAPGATSLVMGAVMVAGMVPPLSLALAMTLYPKGFPKEDIASKSVLWVLGATFVTESVISYTVKGLLHILPGFLIGCMTAAGLSMFFECGISLPHGGLFAIIIPGAVTHLIPYLVSLIIGIVVSTSSIIMLKRRVNHE